MTTANEHGEMLLISIEQIIVNPYQPRTGFADDDLRELAESIQAVGILHPPLVRKLENSENYELISGERRCRAARIAGLKHIPVFIRTASEQVSAQAALIENVQRVDLNPLEIAKSLKKLSTEFGYSQDALAKRIGKKRSTVANYLRLLSLPESIQESVTKNLITMGHAKAILSLEGRERQLLLHEIVLRDHLTVREAEEMSIKMSHKDERHVLKKDKKDIYINNLVEKIQDRLDMRVSIKGKGEKGVIAIEYTNLDALDRLLKVFGVDDV